MNCLIVTIDEQVDLLFAIEILINNALWHSIWPHCLWDLLNTLLETFFRLWLMSVKHLDDLRLFSLLRSVVTRRLRSCLVLTTKSVLKPCSCFPSRRGHYVQIWWSIVRIFILLSIYVCLLCFWGLQILAHVILPSWLLIPWFWMNFKWKLFYSCHLLNLFLLLTLYLVV